MARKKYIASCRQCGHGEDTDNPEIWLAEHQKTCVIHITALEDALKKITVQDAEIAALNERLGKANVEIKNISDRLAKVKEELADVYGELDVYRDAVEAVGKSVQHDVGCESFCGLGTPCEAGVSLTKEAEEKSDKMEKLQEGKPAGKKESKKS